MPKMKTFHILPAWFALYGFMAHGQIVNVCELGRNPARFNGQMISVRGSQSHSWEAPVFYNGQCEAPLVIETPGNAGVHVKFSLKDDDSWKKYEYYESFNTPVTEDPNAKQYMVTATFHGLIIYRPPKNGSPLFTLKMVVESVSDVKVEEH